MLSSPERAPAKTLSEIPSTTFRTHCAVSLLRLALPQHHTNHFPSQRRVSNRSDQTTCVNIFQLNLPPSTVILPPCQPFPWPSTMASPSSAPMEPRLPMDAPDGLKPPTASNSPLGLGGDDSAMADSQAPAATIPFPIHRTVGLGTAGPAENQMSPATRREQLAQDSPS